jgi:hypothetical protein
VEAGIVGLLNSGHGVTCRVEIVHCFHLVDGHFSVLAENFGVFGRTANILGLTLEALQSFLIVSSQELM